jgi:hypothetical protein
MSKKEYLAKLEEKPVVRSYKDFKQIAKSFKSRSRILRGGVIPFIKSSNAKNIPTLSSEITREENVDAYLFYGVDFRYKELTDFGGGIKASETTIEGALREFKEESLDVFGPVSPEQVENSIVVYNKLMAIFFIEFKSFFDDPILTFEELVKNFKKPEISSIEVHKASEIIDPNLLRRMYTPVRNFTVELFQSPYCYSVYL